MAKQLKGGYLLRYKKKLFWQGSWKEEWIVLYENSNLVWYKNRDRPTPKGGILISESPELLAVGLWTLRIPNRPVNLPHGFHTRQLIAIGTKGQEKVHWFLCKSEDEINEWMTVISNTLPDPPTRAHSKISYNTMNKSFDDVIGTPNHLRNKEIFKNPKSALNCKLTNSPNNYHLPKSSSSSSIGLHAINSVNSFNKFKNTSPNNGTHQIQHYGSSGQLQSVDTKSHNMDTVASTLAIGTALGVWSHGFGWGWGPGWGWSGWGTNTTPLSLSHPDFSSTIFRTDDYLPMHTSSFGTGTEGAAATLTPSTYLHHYDNSTTNAGNFFDTSTGLAGTGDDMDMSSAFDAFGGGDFGF